MLKKARYQAALEYLEHYGENFFITPLGFAPLPADSLGRSHFPKPRDPHAVSPRPAAWDASTALEDLRIKMWH